MTADEQAAGRGRQGRPWTAPPGSAVLMSLVLRELDELLPLTAAVAVCEALPGWTRAVKWPNDVWIDRRKVAGILVEGRPQEGWAVLGIGLNVSTTSSFRPSCAETATSLHLSGTETTAIGSWPTCCASLSEMARRAARRGPVSVAPAGRTEGRARPLVGRRGHADGIDDSGALLVETRDGRVTLDAGEVHLLR